MLNQMQMINIHTRNEQQSLSVNWKFRGCNIIKHNSALFDQIPKWTPLSLHPEHAVTEAIC